MCALTLSRNKTSFVPCCCHMGLLNILIHSQFLPGPRVTSCVADILILELVLTQSANNCARHEVKTCPDNRESRELSNYDGARRGRGEIDYQESD